MKKISIILSLCAFMVFSTTNAQKRYLSGNEIPSKITSYVAKYFPNATIKKVKEEKKPLKVEYEVKLNSRTELEFDGDLKIKEIESKTGIPNQTLPEKIQKYLAENHAGIKVKEWKLKTGGQKVKLVDGTKLYFDSKNNFVGQK